MNINKFTKKITGGSHAPSKWSRIWTATTENEHLFKSIFEVDENVIFYFEKLNVNVPLFSKF
jgi:hypothetical protein